jgi:hypothetical protein
MANNLNVSLQECKKVYHLIPQNFNLQLNYNFRFEWNPIVAFPYHVIVIGLS